MKALARAPRPAAGAGTAFFLLVVGLSVAFDLSENGLIAVDRGLIQRLFYSVSLLWLWFSQGDANPSVTIEE